MLVLSRKKNESIVINGNIVVTIVELRGDKARIGVTCDLMGFTTSQLARKRAIEVFGF